MRGLLALLVLGGLAAVFLTRAEPWGPQVDLTVEGEAIGRATPLVVTARDRGSGLARIEVRLASGGGASTTVAAQDFPPRSLGLPWTVDEEVVRVTVDAGAARLPEGPATLEVWAADHSWSSVLRRGPRLTRAVTVDLTPPTLEVLTTQHVVRLGGAECLVYRVGADAVASGVQVGERFFPGESGGFADPALRAALFAVPQDVPDARPVAVAADAAGNRRVTGMDVSLRRRTFADKTLPITDDFLSRKVPELLQANGLDPGGDLVEGYLRINRTLRASTEEKLRGICAKTAPAPLWDGAFLRMPNSAPLSGFADRRSYVHDGRVIDHQTHLGFDLASLKASPVPAANHGRVVFAGQLGIYGNTVIVDHGLGLFTLYGHLSSLAVAVGAGVKRGDPVGNTGDTGLAAGDHLHFSTMIHGVHVDPVEWWDGHWIEDHVTSRLAAFPRGGSGS